MDLEALHAQAAELSRELATVRQRPHLTDCWLDSATNRKGTTYIRIVWLVPSERYANGKPRKRRCTLKPDEVSGYQQQIERGHRIAALEQELKQVQQAISALSSQAIASEKATAAAESQSSPPAPLSRASHELGSDLADWIIAQYGANVAEHTAEAIWEATGAAAIRASRRG